MQDTLPMLIQVPRDCEPLVLGGEVGEKPSPLGPIPRRICVSDELLGAVGLDNEGVTFDTRDGALRYRWEAVVPGVGRVGRLEE